MVAKQNPPKLTSAWRSVQTDLGEMHLFLYDDYTWSTEACGRWGVDRDVIWEACVNAAKQGALRRYPLEAYACTLINGLGTPTWKNLDVV